MSYSTHTATSHAHITRLPPLLFATPSHPLLAYSLIPRTIALLFHGHFSSLMIALLSHGHFCLPNNRPPLSRPFLPPEQSHASSTATPASRIIARLFHDHFRLPDNRPPLAHVPLPAPGLLSSYHCRTVPHLARSSSPPNSRHLALTHLNALHTTSQPHLLENTCADLLTSIRASLLLLAHVWTLWGALLLCAWIYPHYLSKVVGHLTALQTHFSLSY